jgi:hypothetical protein
LALGTAKLLSGVPSYTVLENQKVHLVKRHQILLLPTVRQADEILSVEHYYKDSICQVLQINITNVFSYCKLNTEHCCSPVKIKTTDQAIAPICNHSEDV